MKYAQPFIFRKILRLHTRLDKKFVIIYLRTNEKFDEISNFSVNIFNAELDERSRFFLSSSTKKILAKKIQNFFIFFKLKRSQWLQLVAPGLNADAQINPRKNVSHKSIRDNSMVKLWSSQWDVSVRLYVTVVGQRLSMSTQFQFYNLFQRKPLTLSFFRKKIKRKVPNSNFIEHINTRPLKSQDRHARVKRRLIFFL